MQPNTVCTICERDTNSPSPQMVEKVRILKSEGWEVAPGHEPTVELDDGGLSHQSCQLFLAFLREIDPSGEVVEKRLKGYRAGKPRNAYMNPPYGLDGLSVNSYRVIMAAYHAMRAVEDYWATGNVLPGECFPVYLQPATQQKIMRVQDVYPLEEYRALMFARIAEAVFSHAITLWWDAHQGGGKKRPSDQEMFLKKCSCDTDHWKAEMKYFLEKRNHAIAHSTTHYWDDLNVHLSYQPYPDWADDWKRFEKLLEYSRDLCVQGMKVQMGEQELHPGMQLRGCDRIQVAVDFVNVFGTPRKTGVGERPPMQGPYPFRHNGTKWVEVNEPSQGAEQYRPTGNWHSLSG